MCVRISCFGLTIFFLDYDCPLSETGDITPKYLKLHELLIQLRPELHTDSSKCINGRVHGLQLVFSKLSTNSIELYDMYCYIVSVKVQFFCIAIGQKRITCRSAKHRVHSIALATSQPVITKHLLIGQQQNG